MDKNYSKNNFYQNKKDIEERVQIAKETCNSEAEIAAAIERSKQKLKSSNPPSGYSKIDEQITTKIYKIPENEYINENNIITEEDYAENNYIGYDSGNYEYEPNYEEGNIKYGKNIYNTDYKKSNVHTRNNYYSQNNNYNNTDYYNKNSNFKLEYVSSLNPRKMKYVENYENNYNYNNRTPKTFTKYVPSNGARIENYYENNISKDGQYLVTISISKIVNDPVPKTYNETKTKNTNTTAKNTINYSNKKETIEISKNHEKPKKEIIKSNINKTNESVKDRFGYNYNYYERKDNISSSKKAETHQRMREPLQIQKINKITKTQSNYSNNLPRKEVKTVTKTYKKEVIGNNGNNNAVKSSTNTKTTKYINTNYKKSGK